MAPYKWYITGHYPIIFSAPRLGYTFTSSRHATPVQQHTKGAGEPSATRARFVFLEFLFFIFVEGFYFDSVL